MLAQEGEAGVTEAAFYAAFSRAPKRQNMRCLHSCLSRKSRAARLEHTEQRRKAILLLNFAGVRGDLLPYVVDRSAAKQGEYLPGSRIPIVDENHLTG